MSDVQLDTFPSTKVEALTMLYLQNQDLSNISPDELAKKYQRVHKEIKAGFATRKRQQIRT